MKRILVTGGAGFLGSHLCEVLVEQGHHVICVDNLYTGAWSNITHLFSKRNFEFIKHDVTVPLYVDVEEIYNLACPASPVQYQQDPILTTKINILGSLNMLGLAKRTGAKILQASTSEVYGDPLQHPQAENYFGNVSPIGIRSCYDEGKRSAESLFFDYNRCHNVKIKVVRIFNTYGPRMLPSDGRVVSNFISQALSGNPITVYGEGAQTRSLCYVDDLITGIIKCMSSRDEFTGPVNLGNPNEFTVLELARKVLALTGSASPIEYRSLPCDDPAKRRPDISLAKLELQWEPTVNIDCGLRRTIGYHSRHCTEPYRSSKSSTV